MGALTVGLGGRVVVGGGLSDGEGEGEMLGDGGGDGDGEGEGDGGGDGEADGVGLGSSLGSGDGEWVGLGRVVVGGGGGGGWVVVGGGGGGVVGSTTGCVVSGDGWAVVGGALLGSGVGEGEAEGEGEGERDRLGDADVSRLNTGRPAASVGGWVSAGAGGVNDGCGRGTCVPSRRGSRAERRANPPSTENISRTAAMATARSFASRNNGAFGPFAPVRRGPVIPAVIRSRSGGRTTLAAAAR